jgi:transglutaminase-like putative cysteine protease
MIYRVRHQTTLTYLAPVEDAQLAVRLRPAPWPGQKVLRQKLALTPEPHEVRESDGPYLVRSTGLLFRTPLKRLDVLSEFEIEVSPPADPGSGPSVHAVRQAALSSRDLTALSPAPYLFGSRIATMHDAIAAWAAPLVDDARGVIDVARTVNSAIHRHFSYMPGTTDSETSPFEAFRAKRGVCQDFAHVMIVALRSQGIPAAYVSGYLRTVPPPGMAKLVGADAMHAWVAVWSGEAGDDGGPGWIGIDPTNDCLAGDSHIVIGMGRDYADVMPVNGVFVGAAPQTMKVAVDVTEILA